MWCLPCDVSSNKMQWMTGYETYRFPTTMKMSFGFRASGILHVSNASAAISLC